MTIGVLIARLRLAGVFAAASWTKLVAWRDCGLSAASGVPGRLVPQRLKLVSSRRPPRLSYWSYQEDTWLAVPTQKQTSRLSQI
jgi:hypothetical protein